MRLASLITGGKDSIFALQKAQEMGNEIAVLLTMHPENPDSYMFQFPNVRLTGLISESLGIPLVEMETKGEKELELDDLDTALSHLKRKYGIAGITTGAVASNYQKSRIDALCKKHHLESIAPAWGRDPEEYIREMLSEGFEMIFTAVGAGGLDENWLGRTFDESALSALIKLNDKIGVSLVGEGGEFETLVVNCPLYKKRIEIKKSKRVWDDKTRSGMLLIEDASLHAKPKE